MYKKEDQRASVGFRLKRPEIKSGTLVIAANLIGSRKPYTFGVVIHHTAGANWLISTMEGDFIYSYCRFDPILETDGRILNAKNAWAKYSSQFFEAIARIIME